MGDAFKDKYNYGDYGFTKLSVKMNREEVKEFNSFINERGMKQYVVVGKLVDIYKSACRKGMNIDDLFSLVEES